MGRNAYNRGNAYESHPLWQLTFLNNIDKHRTIHVVVSPPRCGGVVGLQKPRDTSINVHAIGLPESPTEAEPYGQQAEMEIYSDIAAEGRTKVASWPMIPIDPNKKMYMRFKPNLDIAFDFTTGRRKSVYDLLGDLRNYLLSDVFPPLVRFLT